MPIDPAKITWDAPPQVVPPAQGHRQGGVILTDPTVASQERRDEARLDIAERKEAREERATDPEFVATLEEARARGRAVAEARASLPVLEERVGQNLQRINQILSDPKSLEAIFGLPGSGVARGGFGKFGTIPGTPAADQAAKLEGLFSAIRSQAFETLKGGGQITEIESQFAAEALGNLDRAQSAESVTQELGRLKKVLTNGLLRARQQAGIIPEGPVTEHGGYDFSDNAVHGAGAERPPSVWDQTSASDEPAVGGSGETYLTPEDRELQSRLREAYAAGAPLSELQAISQEYGRTFPIKSQEALDAARQQGRAIFVDPSGRRTAAQEVLGGVAESEVGAYAIAAANGLLSGGMDEIAGALGMDADTVQAAKEMLRDKYPASSFVGEVSGQAMQLAAGGAAGRAVGMGGRGLAGMEIFQGAAYGAGESNDNRLLGAGLGAGGAVAGQQLARRLIEPGAKAVISKIAQREGIPEEAVERAAREALEGPAEAPSLDEETLALARQAVGWGPRSSKARKQLADMVQADPEAKAAMERLGVELPPDVLSDNTQVKNLTGLARSQPGSEAQAAWQTQVGRAARGVEEAVADMGASRDVAQVSDDVFNRYKASAEALEAQADALRAEVNEAIDIKAPVDAQNLQGVLAEVINDLGGIDAAKKAMSGEERKLLAALGEGEVANKPTYAYLERLRQDIGQALNKGKGPWVDTNEAALKKYYAALAEDRVSHVRQVGGDELAEKLATSNAIFKEMYQIREELVDLFGKDLERGIAPRIMSAITSGSKGDATNLRRIISKLPEDLRKDAVLAGVLTNSLSKSGSVDGFSFTNFAKLYRGLRQNKPVYKEIREAIGPEAAQVLQDVYALSRRIADADSRIERTGRALGGAAQAFNAESLVNKILSHSATRAGYVGGAALGGSFLGPEAAAAGAMGTAAAIQALSRGGKTRTDRVHDLLSSDAMRELVEKASTPEAPKLLNRLAGSREYNNWAARVLGLRTPEQRRNWLKRAITATGTATATTPAGSEADTTTIEVR